MNMETIFDLKNVSYTYMGKINALNDISFKVTPGEQISIMGSNGSGKSTLLTLLDGLIYPTMGEFYAFDSEINEEVFDSIKDNEFRSYFRKRIGFVFQNSDVQLFSSTVFEEVAFGPLQLNMTQEEVKTRVIEVLDMIGITKLKDRYPHTLSGGEKKKVCIAAVLANNPDILLLDEPTAGLDPRTQLWLVELLQELGKAGKTIITATHDLETVEQISKRAIVMGENHRIIVDGDVGNVLNNRELLLSTNLIHEHMHVHGNIMHDHPHAHFREHIHEHQN
jgi:cobalt/nickel transport system ATP-binding protein